MSNNESGISVVSQDTKEDWYKPGPSITEFHFSKAETRVLVGGRGCGKTTAIAVETLGHGWHIPGSKIYILRKTQESNEGSTQETFDQVFEASGSLYRHTDLSLFKRIAGGQEYRLPSLEAVRRFNDFKQRNSPNKQATKAWLASEGEKYCSKLIFAGVPTGSVRAQRFRGFECSLLIFVEADQLEKADWDMGVQCLRWKDAFGREISDYGCILDTNPPSPRHWIAAAEEDEKDSNVDDQEKGGANTIRFWHIPTRENRHNLPTGYVERLEKTFAKNPALYERMVLGNYAEAFDGQPVYHEFTMKHTAERLPWPRGAYLVRGWDFGTANATIFSAYWSDGISEYWWDLFESIGMQSDTERQCARALEITKTIFSFWNDRDLCAGVLDYCDPAGAAKTDTGRSIDVMNTFGIRPGYRKLHLQPSISLVNRMLTNKDQHGNLTYRVDKVGCPVLHVAMLGGYRYPEIGEPGYGSDQPLKGPTGGNYDHPCDAARYAKCNCMRLTSYDMEVNKKSIGKLGQTCTPNKKRLDW